MRELARLGARGYTITEARGQAPTACATGRGGVGQHPAWRCCATKRRGDQGHAHAGYSANHGMADVRDRRGRAAADKFRGTPG